MNKTEEEKFAAVLSDFQKEIAVSISMLVTQVDKFDSILSELCSILNLEADDASYEPSDVEDSSEEDV